MGYFKGIQSSADDFKAAGQLLEERNKLIFPLLLRLFDYYITSKLPSTENEPKIQSDIWEIDCLSLVVLCSKNETSKNEKQH